MNWNYVLLLVAIGFEVLATTALAATHGFTRPLPSVLCIGGYALAFFFLALPLRTIPVGVVYAIWSGAGIVLIAAVARLVYGQTPGPTGPAGDGPDRRRRLRDQPVLEQPAALSGGPPSASG